MNSIVRLDKVILVKGFGDTLNKIGNVYEVANILDDKIIIRSEKTKVAVCAVGFDDFEKHFIKAEDFKGWTRWTEMVGYDGRSDIFYRTNGKKVQVKFLTDKVRAEACCYRNDEFNLWFGVQLAYYRAKNKSLLVKKEKMIEEMDSINHEVSENKKIMKDMVNKIAS